MAGIIALCIGYVFSQFFRAFLAVLSEVLKLELGMSSTDLAYASGAWFLAFALFQFPVGYLLDTRGPRITAGVIFLIFSGGGALAFASATSSGGVIFAMALIGIGCSPALMAPMYIFVRNYDAAKFATLVSVFVGIGTLGNIASSAPLAAAIEAFGWRETGYALAFVCMLVGVSILVLVRDPEAIENKDQAGGGFIDLIKLPVLWPIFPMIFMGYAVAAGLRGSWIGPFHIEVYGYDTLETGRAVLIMSIALVLGTFFYGPMDRIFNSRKHVVLAGGVIVLGLCALMAFQLPQSALVATAIFAAIGFFGASYTVQMAHGKSFVPPHLMGRGVTLLNFCSIGGAGILQWVSGPVVETFASAGDPQSVYRTLFAYYALTSLCALLVYAFSKDAKPAATS